MIKQLHTKTHLYFWATAAITVLTGYDYYTNISYEALEINVNDTYYVISNLDITILIAYALAFIGLIYYLHAVFRVPLIKFLTTIHTLATIGCIILYFLSPFLPLKNDKEFPLFDDEIYIDSFLIIIGSVFIFTQTLLLSNSIISIIKRYRQNKKL
ncbi:hypothetical protein [Algibacter sp. R77976]|uniref:hypothetical protein n=1 Tax=Algibacter sp. R77976 TaxID=3093873 RepID=UPI0037C4F52F